MGVKIQQAPNQLPQLRKLPKATPPEVKVPAQDAVDLAEPKAEVAPPPNTREVRVSRFVRTVRKEALEHLRYLSTIWAFNMVGTTVGTLAFTPLGIHLAKDNAAMVGGMAIGGGVLMGGVGALAGYGLERKMGGPKLDEKSKPSMLAESALTVASGFKAMPKFIYPTVVGATPAQHDLIYDALDRLPLKDVTTSATMHVTPNLVDTGISGMSQPGLTHTRILLDESYLNSPQRGPDLVLHEQAHAVDYSGGYGLLGSVNWRGPFGKGPYVSDYASSNRYEDFAESYEHYHNDPVGFRAEFPEKAAIIEQHQQLTPVESLVDRPAIRDAGKAVGRALGSVPYLRTTLETGLALLSPIQLHRGASALEKGYAQGDEALKLQGKMNLVSGLLMGIPGGPPLAALSSAMALGYQYTTGDDPVKLENANKTADRLMAVASGPFGMATVAVGQELSKAGIDLSAHSEALDAMEADTRSVSGGAMLKGLLCTVGGSVAGSLLGVTIGSALSGAAGAGLSSFWGRIGGGLVGLGAYGAYRTFKSENADPSPYDLTKDDKIFLTKIVGGAVAGAAAGTAVGVVGGRAAGSFLSTLAFGPAAASMGASLGGWAGALIGSYALGKAGAVAGRKLAAE